MCANMMILSTVERMVGEIIELAEDHETAVVVQGDIIIDLANMCIMLGQISTKQHTWWSLERTLSTITEIACDLGRLGMLPQGDKLSNIAHSITDGLEILRGLETDRHGGGE